LNPSYPTARQLIHLPKEPTADLLREDREFCHLVSHPSRAVPALGSTLVYSTYLGGSGLDVGNALSLDNSSLALYVAGSTESSDFPTTPGAFQTAIKASGFSAFEVWAAVVLKGDTDPSQLQAFCRRRLADFKVPKEIRIVSALPRNAMGKIVRRDIAALFKPTEK
jgi:hypothetical protein